MKHVGFEHIPLAKITFTRQEIEDIILVGQAHYDFVCQEACKPGPKGFIYGLQVALDDDDEITASLSSRQVGLVLKILEMSALPGQPERAKELYWPMKEVASRFGEARVA